MSTLFDSTFEDGHLYQKPITTGFHAIYVDGGSLEVSAAAAYAGNYGCIVSPLQYYKACGIQYCGSLARFRQRFYIHPNNIAIADTRSFIISRNYHDDASQILYAIFLKYNNPNLQISFAIADNTQDLVSYSGDTTLPVQWNRIESDWIAGSPGSFQVWLNGASIATLTATNNNNRVMYAGLGVAHWPSYAVSGTFYLDNWKGNDDGSAIGA